MNNLVLGMIFALIFMVGFGDYVNGCLEEEAQHVTFVLRNQSSVSIKAFYFSPSSSTSWGSNQLSSNLPPGYTFTLRNIPENVYDIMLIDALNYSYTLYDWPMYGGNTYTLNFTDKKDADGGERVLEKSEERTGTSFAGRLFSND